MEMLQSLVQGRLTGSVGAGRDSWSWGCEFEPRRWVKRLLKKIILEKNSKVVHINFY